MALEHLVDRALGLGNTDRDVGCMRTQLNFISVSLLLLRKPRSS